MKDEKEKLATDETNKKKISKLLYLGVSESPTQCLRRLKKRLTHQSIGLR